MTFSINLQTLQDKIDAGSVLVYHFYPSIKDFRGFNGLSAEIVVIIDYNAGTYSEVYHTPDEKCVISILNKQGKHVTYPMETNFKDLVKIAEVLCIYRDYMEW